MRTQRSYLASSWDGSAGWAFFARARCGFTREAVEALRAGPGHRAGPGLLVAGVRVGQPVGDLLDHLHGVVVERVALMAVDVDLRVDLLGLADQDHQLGLRRGRAGEV